MPNLMSIDCSLHDYKSLNYECRIQAYTENDNDIVNWFHCIRFRDSYAYGSVEPNKHIKIRYTEKAEIDTIYERMSMFPNRSLSQIMNPVHNIILDRIPLLIIQYINELTMNDRLQTMFNSKHSTNIGRLYCENIAVIGTCSDAPSTSSLEDGLVRIPVHVLFDVDHFKMYMFHLNWFLIKHCKHPNKLFKQHSGILDILRYFYFKKLGNRTSGGGGASKKLKMNKIALTAICPFEDRCKLKQFVPIFTDYNGYSNLHCLLCTTYHCDNKIIHFTNVQNYVESIRLYSTDEWINCESNKIREQIDIIRLQFTNYTANKGNGGNRAKSHAVEL